jgi:uncharacterized protein (TIGR03118 family)
MRTLRPLIKAMTLVLTALSLSTTFTRADTNTNNINTNSKSKSNPNNFNWKNFQSDIAGVARHVDPNLINPWGMALSPSNTIWVNDNGSGVSTVYNPNGTATSLVVTIPPSASNTGGANPTGIVFNGTPNFKVTKGGNSVPSVFIFVSEDGSISGWNPTLDATNAILAVDNGASGAIYKGVTLGSASGHNFLFVTNFHSGHVEIYDENFMRVDTPSSFADATLPAGYAPFGIRLFNNQVYVTYALQDASAKDDVPGPGNGFIDVFDTSGTFVKRLVSNGNLNAPWGLALVPGTFGKFRNALFVGNFGDGRINVYDPVTGASFGKLKGPLPDRDPLVFDGLWDLVFLNKALYFSAGIADEEHGLFGVIFAGK